METEGRSPAQLAFHFNFDAVPAGDFAYDREAQACAFPAAALLVMESVEDLP